MVQAADLKFFPDQEFVEQDGKFYLSKPELYEIQKYIAQVGLLPGTLEQLGISDPDEELTASIRDAIQKILDTYTEMQNRIGYWHVTFKMLVGVAGDVYHYSQNVDVYYGAMRDLLPILQNAKDLRNPSIQITIERFLAIAETLRSQAVRYADNTREAERRIEDFLNYTESDRSKLEALGTRLNDLYPEVDSTLKQLNEDIEKVKRAINDAETKILDKSSMLNNVPYYMWIPIGGWIAGGVVAHQADSDIQNFKQEISKNREILMSKTEELDQETRSKVILDWNYEKVNDTQSKITIVLPAIQRLYGDWRAMADDLTNIKNWVNEQIFAKGQQEDFIIIDQALKTAILKWNDIGNKADNYRINAFAEFVSANNHSEFN